jgi:drug/metabolite transporter (DMT)-like permease
MLVALVRALFMLATASIWAHLAGARLVVWNPRTLWVRSLAGSFSLVCNFYALARLPVADAITFANTYPLWIILGTALYLHQRPTRGELVAVLCGVSGVILIQRPGLAGNRLAVAVALLSAVAAAIAMLGLHRLRGVDPRAVVAHFAGVASVVATVWLLARRDVRVADILNRTTLLLILGVGVSGTIGQFYLTRAYAAGPPTRVAVVGLTQVVFAMILDMVVWRRTFTPLTLAGFALVLAPTAWLAGKAGRRLRQASGASYSEGDTVTAPRAQTSSEYP